MSVWPAPKNNEWLHARLLVACLLLLADCLLATCLACLLLLSALAGLLQQDPPTQSSLINGLRQLPAWMPAILAVLALSYAGRYLRFRLLLSSEGIGRPRRREAWMWFEGFALTATPGKLGELSRVQQLHQQLGYPRQPLLHAFLAERLCDATAVVIWLALLVPGQLQERIGGWSSATALGLGSLTRWRRVLLSSRDERYCLVSPCRGDPAGRRRHVRERAAAPDLAQGLAQKGLAQEGLDQGEGEPVDSQPQGREPQGQGGSDERQPEEPEEQD